MCDDKTWLVLPVTRIELHGVSVNVMERFRHFVSAHSVSSEKQSPPLSLLLWSRLVQLTWASGFEQYFSDVSCFTGEILATISFGSAFAPNDITLFVFPFVTSVVKPSLLGLQRTVCGGWLQTCERWQKQCNRSVFGAGLRKGTHVFLFAEEWRRREESWGTCKKF